MRYLVALIIFLYSLSPAQAAGEFATSFSSTYTVQKSGLTTVLHEISLKNNLAHIYATSYTLAINSEDITSVKAYDELGEINTTVERSGGSTTISLDISRPKIGKDQVKIISISYQTENIAEVIGNTKTINIPRLSKANEAESYTRTILVEGVEGMPTLIHPPPSQSTTDGEFSKFVFTSYQNDSLSLSFGSSVTYKLNLTYELKNKELFSADSELALPPDTGYQRVIIKKLDPEPSTVVIDSDGNWLARYTLRPQEKLLVSAEMFVTVYPVPSQYDPSNREDLVHSTKYWDTHTSIVKNLGDQLKSPENIYSYLTTSFIYNYEGLSGPSERLGASRALSTPQNVLCTEFTDSFVALARYNKISAREINGYGYTNISELHPQNQDSDILHAWPEYFDQNSGKWLAIDPTWGNTTGGINYFNKLDFNHIAFVRHGQEDSYPLPAGAYKGSADDKFIEVEVATEALEPNTDYLIYNEDNKKIIKNIGNTAILPGTIELDDQSFEVGYIPPYGTEELDRKAPQDFWQKISRFFTKLATRIGIR